MKNPKYLSNKELIDEFALSVVRFGILQSEELKNEILRRLDEPWRQLKK